MPGPRTQCPFCTWSEMSHRVPAHILTHHAEKIDLRPVQPTHCLNGVVRHGKQELNFSVCLTCKKGTAQHSGEGHGLRWMSLHEKKASCRAAHAAAMTAFIAKQVTAKAATPPTEDPVPPSTSSSVAALWDECKKNKKMTAIVAQLEKKVTDMSEEFDDDPCFRPEEGFKEAIYNAVGLTRQVDEAKQEMDELVMKHDEEIGKLTWTVREQGKRIQVLETVNTNLSIEVSSLREQIAAMQKEFDAYKKAHP